MNKLSSKSGLLFQTLVCSVTLAVGCTYEAPQTQQAGGAGGATGSSSSGEGGSSGQGGSGPCEPGTSKVCMPYSGPLGTEKVAACIASTSECLMSGTWSPCSMEVIPTIETCASNNDVNCDGIVPCTGAPLKSNPFADGQTGDAELVIALGVGNGSNGDDGPVYAVGGRKGSSLKPLDLFAPLLWQLDKDGTVHDWSNKFSFQNKIDPDGALATGVGVIPISGDVAVSGFYIGGILSIDGIQFSESGLLPISFYTRFSSKGAVLNKRILNAGGGLMANAMTVDSAGNAYIVGYYTGQPQVVGIMFPPAGAANGFILALDPNGEYRWHQTFGGSGVNEIVAITNVNDTNLIVATRAAGIITTPTTGGNLFQHDAGPEADILVSRLRSTDGLAEWSSIIAGSGAGADLLVGGLAADSDHVVVTGRYANTVTINGGAYTNLAGMASADSFIATLEMGIGSFAAHYPSIGVGLQDIRGVAIDSAGDVIITGAYSEQLTLLNTILPTPNALDAFVIKTDKFYNPKWPEPRVFSGSGEQFGQAVIVGKQAGNIYAGGGFLQEFSWPNAPLKSAGSSDAFLITLSN